MGRFLAICGLGTLAAALSIVSVSAAGTTAASRQTDATSPLAAFRRPAQAPHPTENVTTRARAELGEALFFDPRLSSSGQMSCAACHEPSLGWQDGRPRGVGSGGVTLARRTPTLVDVAWVEPLFWDGRAATLEEQAKGPLASEHEMNMPLDRVVETVAATPRYVAAFRTAYPGAPLTIDTVTKAIAAYERTLVSGEAPFDRWAAGDETAVSEPAKRGFALYAGKARCVSCHSGWRFTDDGFRDIGLASPDVGRGEIVPGVPLLQHAFKTPTLRNVAERAPYMHDGSLPTLEAVVDHYDSGFVRRPSLAPQMTPLRLTASERADLVAFMRTLSSDRRAPVAQARLEGNDR